MSSTTRFWNWIAVRYSKQPVADQAAYEKKLQITQQYLRPDMEVLEFGCGTGSTAIVHAPYVKHIHAIDISSKMIEIAQGKVDAANIDNVTLTQADIDDFDAAAPNFDAVLGLSILHLVKNRDEVIAKVYRMLKPGGIFVSSTACLGDMMLLFKIIAAVMRCLRFLPTIKVFTAEDLVASLKRAGFQIDRRWQPGKNKALFIVAKKAY
jgi:ubiquinone/menaquinone biosynthesis C-methylase UbiE